MLRQPMSRVAGIDAAEDDTIVGFATTSRGHGTEKPGPQEREEPGLFDQVAGFGEVSS